MKQNLTSKLNQILFQVTNHKFMYIYTYTYGKHVSNCNRARAHTHKTHTIFLQFTLIQQVQKIIKVVLHEEAAQVYSWPKMKKFKALHKNSNIRIFVFLLYVLFKIHFLTF